VRPAGGRARAQRQELQKLREDVKVSRTRVGRLRDIDATLGQARQQDVAFYQEKFLPAATGFSSVVDELEKLAQSNSVRKGGVGYTYNEVPEHPELRAVEITTTLEGDYANIVQFVNRVERDPLFLVVDQIGAAGPGPLMAG